MMLLADEMVQFGNSVSCSDLSLVTSSANVTEIDVMSTVTSNKVKHSPSSILVFLISSANSLLFLTW